jgi:hypothetical protein
MDDVSAGIRTRRVLLLRSPHSGEQYSKYEQFEGAEQGWGEAFNPNGGHVNNLDNLCRLHVLMMSISKSSEQYYLLRCDAMKSSINVAVGCFVGSSSALKMEGARSSETSDYTASHPSR